MQNRIPTKGEVLHLTIRSNQSVLLSPAPCCPVCGAKTRQGLRGGTVYDLCSVRSCSWGGAVRLPELQSRVKQMMGQEVLL